MENIDEISRFENTGKALDNQKFDVKQKKCRKLIFNIDRSVQVFLEKLDSSDSAYVSWINSSWSLQPKRNGNRRSNYIGVSKNGVNWQAMINSKKRKLYIGTFSSQLEAAIAYDFYCIILQSKKNKSNFVYSRATFLEMIENFYQNERKLNPSLFVSSVQ
jgi:hypothetical protein